MPAVCRQGHRFRGSCGRTSLRRSGRPRSTCSLWCISDLLAGLPPALQSSTQAKAERLGSAFAYGPVPALTVAVGTAASAVQDPALIGCVAVGTSIFMHDAGPLQPNNPSNWQGAAFDTVIESTITDAMFAGIAKLDTNAALTAFLPMPIRNPNPGDPPLSPQAISIGLGDVGLGTMNITDYHYYDVADKATLDSFARCGGGQKAVSLETTHGVIRMAAGQSPFVFVSGIVNRCLMMSTDAQPRLSSQDMAGGHNAGVVVSYMLASLNANWPS
jgi:hypothetical protein